jgi:hypothetical protein
VSVAEGGGLKTKPLEEVGVGNKGFNQGSRGVTQIHKGRSVRLTLKGALPQNLKRWDYSLQCVCCRYKHHKFGLFSLKKSLGSAVWDSSKERTQLGRYGVPA